MPSAPRSGASPRKTPSPRKKRASSSAAGPSATSAPSSPARWAASCGAPTSFYPHCEKDEQIFLQGAIDCLAEKDGTLTIIDYKTDRVPEGSLLRDHYQRQLRIYGAAAERIFKKPVAGLWLWSFHLREAVPVPFRES